MISAPCLEALFRESITEMQDCIIFFQNRRVKKNHSAFAQVAKSACCIALQSYNH